MNDSKVKVLVGDSVEELYEEITSFISDKIVVDISHSLIEDPRSHRIVIIYKETPVIDEWADWDFTEDEEYWDFEDENGIGFNYYE